MAYVTLSDLTGLIPPDFVTQALDDDGDGQQDVGLFDLIAAQVSEEIDSYLGRRYALPLIAPYPPVVTSGSKTLAAEALYKRRGVTDDKNPFAKKASDLRQLLKAISQGTDPLSPAINRADPTASIITQPMRTTPLCGARNNA